ncbi:hypothetical protein [uncultured Bacteroides sp.]|jgi:hypothetical protein|uniref:hypothetical protein n=1 Tax=uncultured Bacteroides sp. TaxID=162156 RepID=UPI002064C9AD|nr:hypothetical protein [uncultured Bacteroides sp.]DAL45084.1 MAG TPA_asm: hypothetical protein [Caudoviricetes sp.]
MAKKEKSSIYVDAQSLLYTFYNAQFEMDKRDRAVLAVRLLDHTEAIISHFSLAYRTEDKVANIDKMLAHFEVVKVESRFAIDEKMFKKPCTINRVRELIVRMDEGIVKWRNYVVSARQD